MTLRSLLRIALAVMPLLAALHVGIFYPQLPAQVASHFGFNGDADGWMSRTGFAASYVGMVAFIACVFGSIGWLLQHSPNSIINLPRKDYWLAPERRERTIDAMSGQLAGFGLATTAFLMFVFHACMRANLNGTMRLGPEFGVVFVIYLTAILAFTIRMLMRYSRVP
jgi:uncharacterized membrane protein